MRSNPSRFKMNVSCALQLDYLRTLKLEEYLIGVTEKALQDNGLTLYSPPSSGHISIPVALEEGMFSDLSSEGIAVRRAYVALRQFYPVNHPLLTLSFISENNNIFRTADDEDRSSLFFQREYFILHIELEHKND